MTALFVICSLMPFLEPFQQTIFHDDFNQAGTQWQLGPCWTIEVAQGVMQEYFSEIQTFIAYETDTAFSPPIYIPMGTESIYVSIPYSYSATLGLYGNNFWMYLYLKLLAYNEDVLILDSTLESYTGSGSSVSFYEEDECMILLPSGSWEPGDQITIALAGTAYSEHANTTEPTRVALDWDIESVTLWDEYPSVLERNTWASVKSFF